MSIINIGKAKLALVGLLSLFVTLSAAAADPRLGSWTLTSAQSSLEPPDKLSIVSANGTVHVLMTGETHLDFTADSNGKQSPVASNPAFDQVQLHRMGRKQVEVVEKKNGATISTIRNVLSKDGSELTLTTTRLGHLDQVSVWTRAGMAQKSPDPFAGDWVQDVSKSRMRKGLSLTIDAAGSGVHFAGDYSYTANFDGKTYDVKNSRNDTVQLAQPDAHTVKATFRRDGHVSQEEQWVVAPDGKTMTLTTSGSLETGQHFSEKLVFQKK